MKYPIGEHNKQSLRGKTGKSLDEMTIENIKAGKITAEDIKISKENLLAQSEIAVESGRTALAHNFIRASELVDVPDEIILNMYNKLRPGRSTKNELLEMAHELREKYLAQNCANLVEDAASVYEKRGMLL